MVMPPDDGKMTLDGFARHPAVDRVRSSRRSKRRHRVQVAGEEGFEHSSPWFQSWMIVLKFAC
jgi:hypothetical protein